MGSDNANIFNHSIQYSNGKELIAQLEERLELPVYNQVFNEDETRITELPPGFNGLLISTDDSKNLDDYIKTGQLLTFDRICPGDSGDFDINPYVIKNSLPEAYLDRWWDTAQMCKLIRLYGLMSFEEYDAENLTWQVNVMHGPYVLQKRKLMQPHIQKNSVPLQCLRFVQTIMMCTWITLQTTGHLMILSVGERRILFLLILRTCPCLIFRIINPTAIMFLFTMIFQI